MRLLAVAISIGILAVGVLALLFALILRIGAHTLSNI